MDIKLYFICQIKVLTRHFGLFKQEEPGAKVDTLQST